jgi:hypothetical protein
MTQSVDLIFSDFVPDRGGAPWAENPGYLIDAQNVRFTPNGYRSTYLDDVAVVGTTAIGATPLAARAFADVTNPRHYVGTATKIFESNDSGATWFDNAGAVYTGSDWDFAIYGTTVIAVNGADVPQTKSLDAAVANNFAALGGTPPTSSLVAIVRDSTVLGTILSIQWSSIGDPTDWPTPGGATALARQAGSYTPSREFGVITRIVGGEKFGLIFQERAITRMTYVGGDIVFTFDVYARGIGTGYAHSTIVIDGWTYFKNSAGFFRTDGYAIQPLSYGKIDDAFIRRLLSHPLEPTLSFKNGVAYDSRTQTIYWPFVVSALSSTYLLGFSIPLQQFLPVKFSGSFVDGTLYSINDVVTTNAASVVPYCIDSNQKLRQFSKIDTVATAMRTGFVELSQGSISELVGVEVIGANHSVSPSISVRSEYDTTAISLTRDVAGGSTYNPATKSITSPMFRLRQSGRYHSFEYVDSAQTAAALVRGLRVYYETKSGR